jgi:hypothetical protein
MQASAGDYCLTGSTWWCRHTDRGVVELAVELHRWGGRTGSAEYVALTHGTRRRWERRARDMLDACPTLTMALRRHRTALEEVAAIGRRPAKNAPERPARPVVASMARPYPPAALAGRAGGPPSWGPAAWLVSALDAAREPTSRSMVPGSAAPFHGAPPVAAQPGASGLFGPGPSRDRPAASLRALDGPPRGGLDGSPVPILYRYVGSVLTTPLGQGNPGLPAGGPDRATVALLDGRRRPGAPPGGGGQQTTPAGSATMTGVVRGGQAPSVVTDLQPDREARTTALGRPDFSTPLPIR